MAIDTHNDRLSMIGFGSPIPFIMPEPTGTIGEQFRAVMLYLSYDVSLSAPVAGDTQFVTCSVSIQPAISCTVRLNSFNA